MNMSYQESGGVNGGYDRGRAINKLVMLGQEARKLVSNMDNLLMPEDEVVIAAEKRIKKKITDHKRALNMLPDAE